MALAMRAKQCNNINTRFKTLANATLTTRIQIVFGQLRLNFCQATQQVAVTSEQQCPILCHQSTFLIQPILVRQ